MANGMLALVKEGIMHRYLLGLLRDLKPANILLKDGKIKIADFGVSKKPLSALEAQEHTHAGTPLYMSPQVLNYQPYSSKCDIWSLGIIFY